MSKIDIKKLTSLKQKEINEDILNSLLNLLPNNIIYHSPDSDIYKYISKVARYSVDIYLDQIIQIK